MAAGICHVAGMMDAAILSLLEILADTALLTAHTVDAHAQSKQLFLRSDEECLSIFSAKTDIRGPASIDGNRLDLLPLGAEHGDAVPGQIHVALVIDRHAIGTHLAEESLVEQCPIRLDVVRVGLAGSNVGHIERLSVGRADDPVRLLQVVDDADQFFLSGAR